MEIPRDYVSNWVGYWGFVADRVMRTWDRAAVDIDNRDYSPTKMISDAAGLWNTALVGWCLPWKMDGRPKVIVFVVKSTDENAPAKDVPIFAPSCPKHDPVAVILSGPHPDPAKPDKAITASNIDARWADGKHMIFVGLKGLVDPAKKEKLLLGTYQVLIRVGDVPIASVCIDVIP